MRVLLAFLFLLGVTSAWLPARADTLPTAQEIKDKAAAASGTEPQNYRETIVETSGDSQIKTVEYRYGKNVRSVTDDGSFHSEEGTYHGESWHTNSNGLTIIDAEAQAPNEQRTTTVTRVTSPVDAFLITDLNVRSAGTRSYYDPATFHLIRREFVNSTGTRIVTYSDFRQFGPRTLPSKWSTTWKDSSSVSTSERTEYTVDAVKPPDIQEPNTQRRLVEFPTGVTRVELPATFVYHSVYIRLMLGSSGADFKLDTGSAGIAIDEGYAKSLGLKLTNGATNTAARSFTEYETKLPDIGIGALRMHDIAANIIPLGAKSMAFRPVDPNSAEHLTFAESAAVKSMRPVGLLGFDFLAQLGLTIDYEHQKVIAVPGNAFTPPTDPLTIPFDVRLADQVPMTTVSVTGAQSDSMIFDTGYFYQLAFFDRFARRYPDAFQDKQGSGEVTGVGGDIKVDVFKFKDVAIGNIRLQDFNGIRTGNGAFPGDGDGLIGAQLLSLFTVSLDYTHGRIYLTPAGNMRKYFSSTH